MFAGFDDSCEEIYQEKEFAVSGRHKTVNGIFVKHNLFHQSKWSRTIDLNTWCTSNEIFSSFDPRQNQVTIHSILDNFSILYNSTLYSHPQLFPLSKTLSTLGVLTFWSIRVANQSRMFDKGVGLGLFPSDSLEYQSHDFDKVAHMKP